MLFFSTVRRHRYRRGHQVGRETAAATTQPEGHADGHGHRWLLIPKWTRNEGSYGSLLNPRSLHPPASVDGCPSAVVSRCPSVSSLPRQTPHCGHCCWDSHWCPAVQVHCAATVVVVRNMRDNSTTNTRGTSHLVSDVLAGKH